MCLLHLCPIDKAKGGSSRQGGGKSEEESRGVVLAGAVQSERDNSQDLEVEEALNHHRAIMTHHEICTRHGGGLS